MRKLQILLTINVEDLPDNVRKELADQIGVEADDPEEGLPRVAELQPSEIAGLIPGFLLHDEMQLELFAGSDLYAKFAQISVDEAHWLKDCPSCGGAGGNGYNGPCWDCRGQGEIPE